MKGRKYVTKLKAEVVLKAFKERHSLTEPVQK